MFCFGGCALARLVPSLALMLDVPGFLSPVAVIGSYLLFNKSLRCIKWLHSYSTLEFDVGAICAILGDALSY